MLPLVLALSLAGLPADAPVEPSLVPPPPPSGGLVAGGVSLIAAGATVSVLTGLVEALYLANVVPSLQSGRPVGVDAWLIMGGMLVTFAGSVVAVVVGGKLINWFVTLNRARQTLLQRAPTPARPTEAPPAVMLP